MTGPPPPPSIGLMDAFLYKNYFKVMNKTCSIKKMNMNNFFLNNPNLHIERGKAHHFALSNCDESTHLSVTITSKRIDLIVLARQKDS